ncbi:MAG: hypothetical protein H6991_09990 [Pseudomonadales bacterium]|nr:hypothetical protein [Pseudomonadales bacterium]
MGKVKKIPSFANEAEERAFWESHTSTDYLEWSKAEPASFAYFGERDRLFRAS